MTTNQNSLVLTVKEFWSSVPDSPEFPRDIESAVLWGLPLAIIKIPLLGLDSIQAWMNRNQMQMPPVAKNRRVRACIVARHGVGVIFVDGVDSENEMRFSIAHEAAHFMLDYQLPRQAAIQRFGIKIAEVLDGERQATMEEKLSGVLSGIKVGPFVHTLNRNTLSSVDVEFVNMEDSADLLALELLAPASDAIKIIKRHGCPEYSVIEGENRYGVPGRILETYFRYVLVKKRPTKSFKEWLGRPE